MSNLTAEFLGASCAVGQRRKVSHICDIGIFNMTSDKSFIGKATFPTFLFDLTEAFLGEFLYFFLFKRTFKL